jgi:hypothetical protein
VSDAVCVMPCSTVWEALSQVLIGLDKLLLQVGSLHIIGPPESGVLRLCLRCLLASWPQVPAIRSKYADFVSGLVVPAADKVSAG